MARRPRKPDSTASPTRRKGCDCSPAPVSTSRLAEGVDASLKAANLRQLRRIEGQVRGIAAMVEGDRYCADIISQVAAATESLRTVARNLLRNHLRHCAAAAMGRRGPSREAMIDELLTLTERMNG